MATEPPAAKKFLHYPEPLRGPDVPYKIERKENPAVRGIFLLVSALILEGLSFVRATVWKNTGFADLRKIQSHIEYFEPRFDPTVIAVADPSASMGKDTTPNSNGITPSTKSSALYYSAADYRALYLKGELTPTAVVKAILPLIRKDLSPAGEHAIAFFDTRVDLVIAAAKASTLRYKEKRSLGPLDGVPTAIKDEYDVDGYTTCLGSVNDYTGAGSQGSITSWCVRKLDEAGTINLGKLSMHEFGLDTSGNNPFKGTPTNPHNSGYYTGGSSSGCGYVVSAGLVPFALGGDGGGSIRIPASFCSVYGLKPTHGRISFKPAMNHSSSCAVNGPLACDIASLSAFYEVIGVPYEASLFGAPNPLLHSPSSPSPKLLGIPEDWFARAEPGVQKLCRSLIDRLVSTHNYKLVPITIPFLPEGQLAHAMTVLTDAATLLPVTKNLTPANRIMIALGTVTPATDYLLAQKLRQLLMQHLAYLWKEYPGMIIMTPTTACAGWPIRNKNELKYGVSDGNQTLKTMEYVWMANFLGLPSLSVPAGFVVSEGKKGKGEVAGEDVEGRVPCGLMAMGEWASEDQLLRFGLDTESVGLDRQARPKIWVDVIEKAREVMKNNGGNDA